MFNMTVEELEKHIEKIPSMGGRQIGHHIEEAVSKLKPDENIIELGTWLGAGTAQIAMALKKQGKNNKIFTHDRFLVSSRQPLKAGREGVKLVDGQDSFPVARAFLEPFPNIRIIKSEIKNVIYNHGKIGLYIDDACKQKERFKSAMRIFSPYFIPNKTILIMMDFYLFKNTRSESHKYQYKFMKKRPDKFERIKKIETTYQDEKQEFGAIFLYKGGQVI